MNSPIKWVGSKRQLAKYIIEQIPEHICYCEPFFGGGSVYFNKQISKVEIINDYDGNVINFFEVLRDDEKALSERINNTLISRELFLKYRESNWNELKPLEKAFRFFYITKCSFGGLFRFNQQGKCNSPFAGSPSPKAKSSIFSQNTKKLIQEAHKRLQNTVIENDDYKAVVKRYDGLDTFFFFDPPYDTDYSYGIKFDYDELLNVCKNITGKFILTLNHEMYDKFKEFNITETEVNYSVTCKDGDNKTKEILISNYKI